MKQSAPRTISLTEVCEIIAKTITDSAPAMQEISAEITAIDHPIAQTIGNSIALAARFALSLLPLLQDEDIQVVDRNGMRRISDQQLVLRALKAVRSQSEPIND